MIYTLEYLYDNLKHYTDGSKVPDKDIFFMSQYFDLGSTYWVYVNGIDMDWEISEGLHNELVKMFSSQSGIIQFTIDDLLISIRNNKLNKI